MLLLNFGVLELWILVVKSPFSFPFSFGGCRVTTWHSFSSLFNVVLFNVVYLCLSCFYGLTNFENLV